MMLNIRQFFRRFLTSEENITDEIYILKRKDIIFDELVTVEEYEAVRCFYRNMGVKNA
jgi:hypothetical protein